MALRMEAYAALLRLEITADLPADAGPLARNAQQCQQRQRHRSDEQHPVAPVRPAHPRLLQAMPKRGFFTSRKLVSIPQRLPYGAAVAHAPRPSPDTKHGSCMSRSLRHATVAPRSGRWRQGQTTSTMPPTACCTLASSDTACTMAISHARRGSMPRFTNSAA